MIKLIDFQTVVYSSPVLDLINCIISNTEKHMRDKFFHQWFSEYYTSFAELLKKLGGDSHEQFPENIFSEHCRKYGHYGLGVAIFSMPQNECYPHDGDKNNDENRRKIQRYEKRFNDILDDLIFYFGK